MRRLDEETLPKEEEEAFEDLLEEVGKSPNEILISIPNGMSRKAFLKAIEALSQPKKPKKGNYPKCNTCEHFKNNECWMQSPTCATAVFNHEMPTRYDPKSTSEP